MTTELERKIGRAIRLIKMSAPEDGSPIEVAYSGGKDSDVILQLAKEAGVNYRAIYKNTTIDPAYTRKHALDMGAEVLMPKDSFFSLIEKNGLPSHLFRFCCRVLKEYKVLDKVIIGVRRAESKSRASRYTEPTECKYYGSKKPENHVEAIYPILDWTDDDIEAFILDRGIKCAPLYYDEEGRFHVERRLGCMCCPLASRKKRIEQFKMYPNMVKAYIKHAQVFMDTHPDRGILVRNGYKDAYEWFVRDVFYSSQEDWNKHKEEISQLGIGGGGQNEDYKTMLEDYFNIKF